MSSLANLAISWFDFVLVLTILVGVRLGSNRGMSKELLTFIQWTLIILAGGIFYPVLGDMLNIFTGLGATTSNILAYLMIAGVIKLCFMWLTSRLGEKIEDRHIFGSLEYWLGPLAGGVRFACVVLLLLALLNVSKQSAYERERDEKFQRDNYGSVYFPTLGMVNDEVFNRSYTGRWIGQNLNFLLISPGNPSGSKPKTTASNRTSS